MLNKRSKYVILPVKNKLNFATTSLLRVHFPCGCLLSLQMMFHLITVGANYLCDLLQAKVFCLQVVKLKLRLRNY